MKVSVSLPAEDVAFLDDQAESTGTSRSAIVHKAVRLLKGAQLGTAYEQAWEAWEASGEEDAWEAATRDGLET